jgi:hypothetical protein
MKAKRHCAALAPVAALLLVGQALAQAAPGTPPDTSEDSSTKEWSFSLAAFGYLVPNDQSYGSPTFTADHQWLHLEARYNYENQQTGSLWAGYNFSVGQRVTLEIAPMFGVVFGKTTGVAPGYNLLVGYRKLELTSQGEYVYDTGDQSGSFFYTWNELVYSPVEWFHAGLVAQRTRAYQTPLDVQRGFSGGFVYKHADFTTYVFNAGWTDPTVVLALTFKF